MTIRWMLVAFVLTLLALPLAAQDAPRFTLGAGFTYFRFDSKPMGFAGASNLSGGKLVGTWNIKPRFAVVAETSYAQGTSLKIYDGVAGARIYRFKGGARFFAEALFGRAKSHVDVNTGVTSSSLAYVGGIGMEHDLTTHWGLRVEAHYVRTNMFKLEQNNEQISAGIFYRWGRLKIHKPEGLPKQD